RLDRQSKASSGSSLQNQATSATASGGTSAEASGPLPTRSPTASPKRTRRRAWMAAGSSAGIPLRGSRRVFADQPALLLDLLLELHQPLGERFGPRRTAGNVH